jgi:Fe-S-cluster containining protein
MDSSVLNASVANGLKFQCKQCGRCCSCDTDGFVYLFYEDVDRIAAHLNMSNADFAREYIQLAPFNFHLWDEELNDTGETKKLPVLALRTGEKENCIFLYEDKGKQLCRIYAARPTQCRTYPLWSMYMAQGEDNLNGAKEDCPGFTIDEEEAEDFPITTTPPEIILQAVEADRTLERKYVQTLRKAGGKIHRVYPFLPTDIPRNPSL